MWGLGVPVSTTNLPARESPGASVSGCGNTWFRVSGMVQGFRFRVQGFGFKVLGLGFRFCGNTCCGSVMEVRPTPYLLPPTLLWRCERVHGGVRARLREDLVSGFGFLVSGMVQGFRFRVQGFGFKVLGLGVRFWGLGLRENQQPRAGLGEGGGGGRGRAEHQHDLRAGGLPLGAGRALCSLDTLGG